MVKVGQKYKFISKSDLGNVKMGQICEINRIEKIPQENRRGIHDKVWFYNSYLNGAEYWYCAETFENKEWFELVEDVLEYRVKVGQKYKYLGGIIGTLHGLEKGKIYTITKVEETINSDDKGNKWKGYFINSCGKEDWLFNWCWDFKGYFELVEDVLEIGKQNKQPNSFTGGDLYICKINRKIVKLVNMSFNFVDIQDISSSFKGREDSDYFKSNYKRLPNPGEKVKVEYPDKVLVLEKIIDGVMYFENNNGGEYTWNTKLQHEGMWEIVEGGKVEVKTANDKFHIGEHLYYTGGCEEIKVCVLSSKSSIGLYNVQCETYGARIGYGAITLAAEEQLSHTIKGIAKPLAVMHVAPGTIFEMDAVIFDKIKQGDLYIHRATKMIYKVGIKNDCENDSSITITGDNAKCITYTIQEIQQFDKEYKRLPNKGEHIRTLSKCEYKVEYVKGDEMKLEGCCFNLELSLSAVGGLDWDILPSVETKYSLPAKNELQWVRDEAKKEEKNRNRIYKVGQVYIESGHTFKIKAIDIKPCRPVLCKGCTNKEQMISIEIIFYRFPLYDSSTFCFYSSGQITKDLRGCCSLLENAKLVSDVVAETKTEYKYKVGDEVKIIARNHGEVDDMELGDICVVDEKLEGLGRFWLRRKSDGYFQYVYTDDLELVIKDMNVNIDASMKMSASQPSAIRPDYEIGESYILWDKQPHKLIGIDESWCGKCESNNRCKGTLWFDGNNNCICGYNDGQPIFKRVEQDIQKEKDNRLEQLQQVQRMYDTGLISADTHDNYLRKICDGFGIDYDKEQELLKKEMGIKTGIKISETNGILYSWGKNEEKCVKTLTSTAANILWGKNNIRRK